MKVRIGLLVLLLALGAGAGVFLATRIGQRVAREELRGALLQAEASLREGQPAQAADTLARWRERAAKGELGERRLALDMKALDGAGRAEDARVAAERYLAAFPEGPARPDAEFIRLRPGLEKSPTNPKLREQADALLARYPDHPGAARLQLALARAEIARGEMEPARQRLQTLWESGAGEAPERAQVAKLLGDVNLELLMRPDPLPGETVIQLKQGQYLYNIARDHKVPLELLMKVNGIEDPKKLRIGQEIRIPRTQFSLVCDIGDNTLTLFDHGKFFKQYAVRTGRRANSTPTGEFKIINKKTDPTWRSPIDGKTYAPGDPNNELGTRWMSFDNDRLGIHGTIHPGTIGHYASNGCIGMLKEDVEELFDLIPVGTPLKIQGKQDLTRHRVIDSAPAEVALR